MGLFLCLSKTTVSQLSVHTSHFERGADPISPATAETTNYTARAQPFGHEDGRPGNGDQLFAVVPSATGGGRCRWSHYGPRRPKHERAGISHGGDSPTHGGCRWCPSSNGGPIHVHSPASTTCARTTTCTCTRARGPGANRGASGAGGGSPPSRDRPSTTTARGRAHVDFDGSAATSSATATAPHRHCATAGAFGNFATATTTAITGPDSGPVTGAHIPVASGPATSAASSAGSSSTHAANCDALTSCTSSSSFGNQYGNVDDGAGSQPDCRIRPGCKARIFNTGLS